MVYAGTVVFVGGKMFVRGYVRLQERDRERPREAMFRVFWCQMIKRKTSKGERMKTLEEKVGIGRRRRKRGMMQD